MRYKYKRFLNDLKDLKHIEWFLSRSQEYEFGSSLSQKLLLELKQQIVSKNIYYSDIVKKYNLLIGQFDNDPYNYMYDTTGDKEHQQVKSSYYSNYFINVQDKEGNVYKVPYQYLVENPTEHNMKQYTAAFQEKMMQYRVKAIGNFGAVLKKYYEYWTDSGVEAAIERFKSVDYGKAYQIPKMIILYFVYNIILFMIMHEIQYGRVFSHLGALLSGNREYIDFYFSGYRLWGILVIIATAYFLFLDCIYTYGIYYMIFMKQKYTKVVKYHSKVATHLIEVSSDYEQCKIIITHNALVKRGNRAKHYIPLLELSNRRYNFMIEKKVTEDGQVQTKQVVESIHVPIKMFYSHSISKSLIGITVLLAFVQAICNYTFMLFI